HVVTIFAAFDRVGAKMRLLDRTLNRRTTLIVYFYAIDRRVGDIALGEVDKAPRNRQQRVDIRGNELFILRQSHDERTAAARTDDVTGFARRDRGDRVGAAQARERLAHGVKQAGAGRMVVLNQMCDDFGVGFAREFVAERFQFSAQRLVVLDDAVMHDGNRVARGERVRVD